MSKIRPGQWCLVITNPYSPKENLGRIVQALHPGIPPSHNPYREPCWRIDRPLIWAHVDSSFNAPFPYCPEKYLQPLPDLDEPVENLLQKPLDIPLQKA